MKRKNPSSPRSTTSPSPDDFDASTPLPDLKRRRCNTLESGFAHLTLNPLLVNATSVGGAFPNPTFPQTTQSPLPGISEFPNSFSNTNASTPFAMDAESPTPPILRPTSIKEPVSPLSSPATSSIADIKMKSSSWYEPEPDRIVITTLDSSSDEEDTGDDPDPEPASLAISPALLERIKSRSLQNDMGLGKTRDPSKALVLFRPLPLRGGFVQHSEKADTDVVDTPDVIVDTRGHIVVDKRGAVVVDTRQDVLVDTEDDYAMDVEP